MPIALIPAGEDIPEANPEDIPVKRGRGRPPGALNKKKPASVAPPLEPTVPEPIALETPVPEPPAPVPPAPVPAAAGSVQAYCLHSTSFLGQTNFWELILRSFVDQRQR